MVLDITKMNIHIIKREIFFIFSNHLMNKQDGKKKKKNQVDYVLYYSGCIIFNFIVCGRIKRNKTMPYFFFFFLLSP